MIAYTLQYIDRSAMSYAAVFSFRTDLDLVGAQYSWLGSCFFLGYLFFEFPGSQVSPLTSLHFILLTHVQIHPATSSSLQNHGNINRHMGRSPDVLGCPSFLRGSRCYPYSVRLLRSPRYSRFRPSHQSILQARGTAFTSRFVVLL